MSHPPPATVMERVKILTDVRKKEIVFSESFKTSKKMSKQVETLYIVVRNVTLLYSYVAVCCQVVVKPQSNGETN